MNWIIASVGVVLIPHVQRFPLWISLAIAGLLAWRYAGLHHGWYQPGRLLRLALALFLTGAIFKEYGTLLGRDAGLAMLAGLTAMKFMEARSLRDFMVVVFLSYWLIAGDFFHSQSLIHGAYMVGATLLCTATLVQLNLDKIRPPRYSLRLAGTILVKALPLMLIMYLLFPRLQGGLWGLPSDAYAGRTGLAEIMRPGSINRLSQSTEPAFRVEFEGDKPSNRDLYWRALVLWDTDGREWRPGKAIALERGKTMKTGEVVNYTVTLEPNNKPWIMTLDRPNSVPENTSRKAGYVLQRKTLVRKRIRYHMQSRTLYRPNKLNPATRLRALALPDNTSARIRALALQWRRVAKNNRDAAQQALNHIRENEFVYTLQPPLLGQNPVDEFLFETRRGFCEHYAAAFVTLMRSAGIPARIVIGYQGGEYNDTGNYMIVRQSDAHSWAEIWVANEGWVRVDPTAAIAPERIELGIDAVRRLRSQGLRLGSLTPDVLRRALELGFMARTWLRSRLLWDAVNLGWYRWVSDYTWDRQEKFLRDLGVHAPTWLGLLAGTVGGMVILTFGIAWFMRLRKGPRDPALLLYQSYCRKLEKTGLKRRPAEGPKDFAQRSAQKLPDMENQIQAITRLYTTLRYGDGPNELLDEMKKQMRVFKSKKMSAA